MEENTTPRRGRKRANPPVLDNAIQAEVTLADHIRNRQIGNDGLGTQAVSDGSSKGLCWLEMVEYVLKHNSHSNRITLVSHPEANGFIETNNLGNIATVKGNQFIQLNTGEVVKI